jgi:glycosyltransferase involved in cell wall biosynthesis
VRVVQFIDTRGIGGAERMVIELCHALRDMGIDVECWHFGNDWLAGQLDALSVPHQILSYEKLYRRAITLPIFWARATALLRRSEADALHTHLLGACFAWAVPARTSGTRHVATLHDVYSLQDSGRAAVMVWAAALLDSQLVGVSPEICASANHWVRGRGTELVFNGISTPRARQGERTETRRKFGAAPTDVIFSTVGRIVGVKRHDLMVRAFLGGEVPKSARLWVVGDGPLRAQYEALASASAVAGRVTFLGESDEVAALLAASDVQLCASDSEGLSMALIEGLAAGLPIVATAVGGNGAIVESGRNGVTVPKGDGVALASAIATLARDPRLRHAMGAESRLLFFERFRSCEMAARYRSIYERLVS